VITKEILKKIKVSFTYTRAVNFGQKSIAKAKRKRFFFRIKKRSEAKAKPGIFSAKRILFLMNFLFEKKTDHEQA
jgi:hypothetical protein